MMMFYVANLGRGALLFAGFWMAGSVRAEGSGNSVSMETMITELVQAPSPIDYRDLRKMGGSGFSDINENNLDIIVFESHPFDTVDGYHVNFTKFTISSDMKHGIRQFHISFEPIPCFPFEKLNALVGLTRHIYPPSHGDGRAWTADDDKQTWRAEVNGIRTYFTVDGSADRCLLYVRRDELKRP